MAALLPKLDTTRLQIALKTCLSLILALAITFQLDWKPSFMAILMCVLQTQAVGATFKKGLLYIAGTLSGAIAGVAMIGMFAHDRRAFIVGMALLTGFGLYRLQGSRYAYAWLISLVTLALVGWLAAQNPAEAFDIAVMRASTICLGVIISFSVHGLLWPIKAGDAFERQLRGFLVNCRGLISQVARAPADDKADLAANRKDETAQVNAIAALEGSLEAATGDTERFRRFESGYRQLLHQLRNLVLAIIALRVDITAHADADADTEARRSLPTDSGRLRALLQTLDGNMEKLIGDLASPRDGTVQLDDANPALPPDRDRIGAVDTAYAAMIDDRIRDIAAQAETVRRSLSTVEQPHQHSAPVSAPPRTPFSLTSVRFRKAAVGGSLVVVTTSFFILTQWPGGLSLGMIFATLAIGFSAMFPIMVVSRPMLYSLVISAAVAAPLYFGVMPRISQFEQLIPWLCLAFLPLLYLQTNRNPNTMLLALFSSIFCIVLLSLDEENQSYSFSTFFNFWIGLAGGFTVPILLFAILNTLVPERAFSQQVCGFFSGCGQFIRKLKKNPSQTPERAVIVATASTEWQGQLKQLQMWSGMMNYARVPANSRDNTQALVASIERVALRLAAAAYSRRKPILEPLRQQYYRLLDACVESCEVIAKALAGHEPVPELPEIGGQVRNIRSKVDEVRRSTIGDDEVQVSLLRVLSVTAHMRLLADELNDCRDKANALDWKAWDRNWF
jgi:uncharacterized membrane protein YccC